MLIRELVLHAKFWADMQRWVPVFLIQPPDAGSASRPALPERLRDRQHQVVGQKNHWAPLEQFCVGRHVAVADIAWGMRDGLALSLVWLTVVMYLDAQKTARSGAPARSCTSAAVHGIAALQRVEVRISGHHFALTPIDVIKSV